MKYLFMAATTLAAFMSSNAAHAATYVLDRSFKGATAVGTITTDGTLGVLSNDNITDFDITVSLQGFSRSFSKAKGWYNIVGEALSANSKTLSFDTALPGNNYFYFQSDTAYFPGVYSAYAQAGGEGVQVYDRSVRDGQTGVLEFAQVAGAVPEPATWATMILGFGAVGTVLRRRKLIGRATLASAI